MQSDMKLVSVSVGLPRRQMMSHGDPVSAHEKHNSGLLRRAIEVATLPESWKSISDIDLRS